MLINSFLLLMTRGRLDRIYSLSIHTQDGREVHTQGCYYTPRWVLPLLSNIHHCLF